MMRYEPYRNPEKIREQAQADLPHEAVASPSPVERRGSIWRREPVDCIKTEIDASKVRELIGVKDLCGSVQHDGHQKDI